MIEFSNFPGKRLIAEGNGAREVRDLRELGCPEWLAAKVEARARANGQQVAAAPDVDVEALKTQAAAISVL